MDLESSINIDSNVFNFSSLGITRTSRLEQYADSLPKDIEKGRRSIKINQAPGTSTSTKLDLTVCEYHYLKLQRCFVGMTSCRPTVTLRSLQTRLCTIVDSLSSLYKAETRVVP